MTDQIKGGKWVILYCDSSVDSFYYDIVLVTEPWMLYWLLIHFIVYRCYKYIVTIVRTDAINIL